MEDGKLSFARVASSILVAWPVSRKFDLLPSKQEHYFGTNVSLNFRRARDDLLATHRLVKRGAGVAFLFTCDSKFPPRWNEKYSSS